MSNLTKREKEILEYLKQEPTISQEELAARFHISRSAAAVHISNLMRKGYILGRGYIFNERSGILVIGKIWVEIEVSFDEKETQKSKIKMLNGGIGYLLASELQGYKAEVSIVTVLGRDELGDQIFSKLAQNGFDTRYIQRYAGIETSKRVIIKNKDLANPQIDIKQVEIFDYFKDKLFEINDEVIKTSQVVLLDGTLPLQVIKSIVAKSEQFHVPISIIGCPLKILKHHNLLQGNQIFLVCFQEEVKKLFSDGSVDTQAFISCCCELVRDGLQFLVVLLQDQRILLVTKKELDYIPVLPSQTIKSPLCFTAGMAAGIASGYELRPAIRRVLGARLSKDLSDKEAGV